MVYMSCVKYLVVVCVWDVGRGVYVVGGCCKLTVYKLFSYSLCRVLWVGMYVVYILWCM